MKTIKLPRLVATRNLAERLVNNEITSHDDSSVLIAARAVDVIGTSFVNALLSTLEDKGINTVYLQGASDDLVGKFEEGAVAKTGLSVQRYKP